MKNFIVDIYNEMDTQCSICFEDPKGRNKAIQCLHCKVVTCRNCSYRYLTEGTTYNCCCGCKKEWSDEFIRKNFTIQQEKQIQNKRNEMVINKYKSYLPKSQPYAEMKTDINKLEKLIIKVKQTDKFQGYKTYILNKLKKEKYLLYNKYQDYIHVMEYENEIVKAKEEQVEIKPIRKCFNCDGFLNSKWKCMKCQVRFCVECHEEKKECEGVPHECSKETLETMKLINKECKKCPGCQADIYKIEGCYQMWCTVCNTAFDWTRGTKINDLTYFHNPHYVKWKENKDPIKFNRLSNSINMRINHIQDIYIILRDRDIKRYLRNNDLKYLLGEKTEENYKKRVVVLDVKIKQLNKVIEILTPYITKAREYIELYENDKEKLISSCKELQTQLRIKIIPEYQDVFKPIYYDDKLNLDIVYYCRKIDWKHFDNNIYEKEIQKLKKEEEDREEIEKRIQGRQYYIDMVRQLNRIIFN